MERVNRKFRFEEEGGIETITILPLCDFCEEVTEVEAVWVGKGNHKICQRCMAVLVGKAQAVEASAARQAEAEYFRKYWEYGKFAQTETEKFAQAQAQAEAEKQKAQAELDERDRELAGLFDGFNSPQPSLEQQLKELDEREKKQALERLKAILKSLKQAGLQPAQLGVDTVTNAIGTSVTFRQVIPAGGNPVIYTGTQTLGCTAPVVANNYTYTYKNPFVDERQWVQWVVTQDGAYMVK